jgi:hypothetical protein
VMRCSNLAILASTQHWSAREKGFYCERQCSYRNRSISR